MSNGNYSTAVIVTCRECGKHDCKIVKGLCERHYKIEYRRQNREKVAAQLRAYRLNHLDELKEYHKNYQKVHAERLKKQRSEKYFANSNEILEKNAIRYQNNKDRYLLAKVSYRAKNREQLLAWNRAYYAKRRAAGELKEEGRYWRRIRRARALQAVGTHSTQDIRDLFQIQRGRCCICKCSIRNGYHVDHINPLSKGGGNGKDNLQLLCQNCNQKKSSRDPIVHMQSLGFLL